MDEAFDQVTGIEIIKLVGTADEIEIADEAKLLGIKTVDASGVLCRVSKSPALARATMSRSIGSSFGDTITGSDANETIVGGAGADILDGGAGADTYVFTSLGILD